LHLKQQNRINNNVSEYGLGYADIGLTYRFNKHIRVRADYVFSGKRRPDATYSYRHQFYTALTLKQKYKRFTFLYRNLVQFRVKDVYSSDDGMVPEIYERNKVTIKYELNKRYSFYIAEELYLPFYQAKSKGLDRSRSFAGMLYNLTKTNQLEFYFAFQQQLNSFKTTKRIFIYGIGYSIEF